MDFSLLYDLLATPSVTGHEEPLQKKALAFGHSFADRRVVDSVGNVIQISEPSAPQDQPLTVLLMGHADEIGFIVTYIDDRGLIHLASAGHTSASLYLGSVMEIWHGTNKVEGVVAPTNTLRKKGDISSDDLLIDIGAKNREEAEAVVAVGDPVCAAAPVRHLLNNNISCRALDDKSGVFVVLEAARRACEAGHKCRILTATTVGEESTGRGAYHAAARLKPDCAIAVDVTWCADAPDTDPAETGDIRLGKGPTLCLSSMVNKKMNERLAALAREKGIPVQYEIASGRTYTDGDTVMQTAQGIPMALISIPERYMHSSAEIVNLDDIERCIELLAAFLQDVDASFDFRPFSAE